MLNNNNGLFVGGYYDDRKFKGQMYVGKTVFSKSIDTYTLEQVLKLGFVQNVISWYEEFEGKSWASASEQEKIRAIIYYADNDDTAGLLYFKRAQDAIEFKNDVIAEIECLEKESVFLETETDRNGYTKEVYVPAERESFSDLVGDELTVIELSNVVEDRGFEDICELGNLKEVLESGCVMVENYCDNELVLINFAVIEIEERIERSIVKVISTKLS